MRLSEALVKAQQVAALADRLTRLATVRPDLRALRNLLLSTLSLLPLFRRNLARRLAWYTGNADWR